jgi:hypothetical protein
MSPLEQATEKKAMTKVRTRNNLVVLLLIVPACIAAFRYYNDLAALITGISPEQVADLGVEALQPLFLTLIYVSVFVLYSAMMAAFVEPQLKEGSFGTWSRYGLVFCLVLYCCSLVASGLL